MNANCLVFYNVLGDDNIAYKRSVFFFFFCLDDEFEVFLMICDLSARVKFAMNVVDMQGIAVYVCFSIQDVVDDTKDGKLWTRNSLRDTIFDC